MVHSYFCSNFTDENYEYENYDCSAEHTEYLKAKDAVRKSGVKVMLTFKQLDIQSGEFHRISKIFDLNGDSQYEIELSPRVHIDRSDFLALVDLQP